MLGLRMRNSQGIVFIWTQTYSKNFKSALGYLQGYLQAKCQIDIKQIAYKKKEYICNIYIYHMYIYIYVYIYIYIWFI